MSKPAAAPPDGVEDLSGLTPQEVDRVLEQAEAEAAAAETAAAQARSRAAAARRRLRRGPRWQTVAGIVAVLCALTMAIGSVLIWSGHRDTVRDQQNRAEFAAAAKQVAVTLLSIDFTDPQTGMQRILDNAVDPFRTEFQNSSDDFVKLTADAKVSTKAVVDAAAVQSATADAATVLVAATTTVTDAEGVAEPPRTWQLRLDLRRDGDRIKMAEVDFVQ
ncbi:hypothetical protein [Mycolicibacterium parafortuitum]|uniref:Mce-associated membrane protein n=1 Tax=Mycolicibacterium parafortuitum TaxID=39692 RepID=A0A375YI51_MYCPF|nr:hypothetical protein [Mycolicibacterium parafortuitum]SRX80807.1 hypothetical protein MPP7335_02552 [Mycolicibacterium parafortuitum]